MRILSEINTPLIKSGFPEKVGNFFNRIIEGPRICLSQDCVGGVRLSLIMDIARYRGHPYIMSAHFRLFIDPPSRPVNLHPLFWNLKKSPKYELQKAGCKKQGHCYLKREEARLLFSF